MTLQHLGRSDGEKIKISFKSFLGSRALPEGSPSVQPGGVPLEQRRNAAARSDRRRRDRVRGGAFVPVSPALPAPALAWPWLSLMARTSGFIPRELRREAGAP